MRVVEVSRRDGTPVSDRDLAGVIQRHEAEGFTYAGMTYCPRAEVDRFMIMFRPRNVKPGSVDLPAPSGSGGPGPMQW